MKYRHGSPNSIAKLPSLERPVSERSSAVRLAPNGYSRIHQADDMSLDQPEPDAAPLRAQSSVVFEGEEFARPSFDERQLFGGELDRERTSFSATIGHFYYSSGARFFIEPDQVSLDALGIWPDELQDAVSRLESTFKALPSPKVRTVTLNFLAIFGQQVDGPTGIDFCEELMNVNALKEVLGYEPRYALPRATLLRGGRHYEVRFEPHFGSGGANAYLSVRVPHDVESSADLSTTLNGMPDVRTYLMQLCSRVARRFGREAR